MLFATFFAGLSLLLLSGARRAVGLALLPWALAICYSRPLLRVHSPTDVSCGALQGVLLGALGVLIAWRLLLPSAAPTPTAPELP